MTAASTRLARDPRRRVGRLGVRLLAAGALSSLAACGPGPSSAPAKGKNVLLIVVDDLRPDLGSYGSSIVQSPNIDRLAARGVRFERAYSQFPVCNPSRSSFLTGLRPQATGVLDNSTHYRELRPEVVTLPEHFRANGYFTASVGKVFHGAGGRNEWSNPEAWDVEAFPRGRRRARTGERERFPYREGKSIGWAAAVGRDREQTDGQVALETIKVLEEARDRPFFVAAGFIRPHTPWIAPKEYFDLYSLPALEPYLASLGVPPGSQPLAPGVSPDRIGMEEQLALLRAYYACVSFVDAQIGLIFDALDRLDLWETTVVVLVSDHGIHLGERSWWWKNTLSEVSARVPLVISAPGVTVAGSASNALVELVDLFPTLIDLFGLPAVPNLDGRSLAPLLRDPGAETEWKRAAYTQALRGGVAGYSVRTDRCATPSGTRSSAPSSTIIGTIPTKPSTSQATLQARRRSASCESCSRPTRQARRQSRRRAASTAVESRPGGPRDAPPRAPSWRAYQRQLRPVKRRCSSWGSFSRCGFE